jgi:hypothetical protein
MPGPAFEAFKKRYHRGANGLHTHTPLGFFYDGWEAGQRELAQVRLLAGDKAERLRRALSDIIQIIDRGADPLDNGRAIREIAHEAIKVSLGPVCHECGDPFEPAEPVTMHGDLSWHVDCANRPFGDGER